ncbi:MAG: hypothetical protein AAGM22_05355 [Acidobacteriota bacterium]
MQRFQKLPLCLAVIAALTVPAGLVASETPLSDIDVLTLEAPDTAALYARDAEEAGPGVPPRYAEPLDVHLTPKDRGTWDLTDDGQLRWRLRIESEGALTLNLGFTRYRMPKDGSLFVYAPDKEHQIRPFTAADNEKHGQLWTPILPGDKTYLEVRLPVEQEHELDLELTRVLYGYKPFGRSQKSGSCNVDVVCPEGDGWRDEIRSVAVIGTGGGTFCSGFMVNNTAQDLKPYFMTAFHCGISAGAAPSLVVYWNYENSTCRPPGSPQSGQPGDGDLTQFQTGSTLRAQGSASDFTLVELDDDPDNAWDVHWAGWDRSTGDFSGAIAIHHPSTDEKRISFENEPTTTTSYLQDTAPGDGTHVRVEDWDVGTTEGGSSGSPLFSPAGHVIGQLHGGFAACGNDLEDWYGRVDVSWVGGGTAATRLSDWLDPTNSGVMTLDGRDRAPDFGLQVSPANQGVCAGDDAVYDITVTSSLGFSETVTLSVSGEPAGTTTGFGSAMITPPGATQLTVSNTGAAASGAYTLDILGDAATVDKMVSAALLVSTAAPSGATLLTPADAATDQPVDVELSWQTIADASDYDVQVATDAGFANIVGSASDITESSWNATGLNGSGLYYWRVRARNGCGDGAWSATRSFGTEVLPGDCPAGQLAAQEWFDDLESGAPGWTSGGTGDTWQLTGGNVHSGANAYHADNVPDVSDQQLVTPSITLPMDRSPLTLQFWNQQQLESSSGGCFDGAVLEISSDGSTWTRLESELLTDAYDGAISDEWGNPLATQNAWCGDPQDWLLSIVDLDAWAGQTVQLRFRLATDQSVERPGWTIDDIAVVGCGGGSEIFSDGFESGDTSAWSVSAP